MTNPTNTVYATKRLIGRGYDDPQTQKEAKVGSPCMPNASSSVPSCNDYKTVLPERVGRVQLPSGTTTMAVCWKSCLCCSALLRTVDFPKVPARVLTRCAVRCLSSVQMVPYKIVKAPNGDAWVEVSGKGARKPDTTGQGRERPAGTALQLGSVCQGSYGSQNAIGAWCCGPAGATC